MVGIRKDIAKLAGPWAPEMLWYALGVRELNTRAFADRTSWLFFGAIHGINYPSWVQDGIVSSTAPLPSEDDQRNSMNQCQHAGWFFLPWHRGYLASFEAVLAEWISANGGPVDWALPYWNYLDAPNGSAKNIPQEFLDLTLPDGSPNPLSTPIRRINVTALAPFPGFPVDINLSAQEEREFTSLPGIQNYGGPVTGFTQQGNAFGALEANPHGTVHVMIGGFTGGWMADPDYAALDPIFWVHHCNIDRLWEAWMGDNSNLQETSNAWKNGPFPRQFSMPTPSGGLSIFVPSDTVADGSLVPKYDDLIDGTGITLPIAAAVAGVSVSTSKSAIIGVNSNNITIKNTPIASKLDITQSPQVLGAIAANKRIFLNLEGIRGQKASGAINVSIILPASDEGEPIIELVETVVLFGLRKASSTDGVHGGNGITTAINITEIFNRLQVNQQSLLQSLEVELTQPGRDEYQSDITVDRISIYEQTL